jgi:hypothetical protein
LIDLVVRQSEEEEKAIGEGVLRWIRSSVLAFFQQILGAPSMEKCKGKISYNHTDRGRHRSAIAACEMSAIRYWTFGVLRFSEFSFCDRR